MRYVVLAVGVLALAGVLAALLLLPPPTAGPVVTPRPTASGQANGSPTPTPQPNADTGAGSTPGFAALPESPTPAPSYSPTAAPAALDVCDRLSASDLARITDLPIETGASSTTAADEEERGDVVDGSCDYYDADGNLLLSLRASAAVGDADEALTAWNQQQISSGLLTEQLIDRAGQPVAAAFSRCRDCGRSDFTAGIAFATDTTWQVTMNPRRVAHANEIFAAIADELLGDAQLGG